MNISSKKSAILLSTITTLLSYIIMFFLTPITLRILGKSEHGLYNLATSVVGYLSLISLGLGSAYVRFYFRAKSGKIKYSLEHLNGMYLITFIFISSIALVFGILIIFFSESILGPRLSGSEHLIAKILISILVFNLIGSFVTSIFQSYIRAIKHFVVLEFLILFKTILSPMITIPLLLLGYGSIGFVFGSTVVATIIEITTIIYAVKAGKMKFNFRIYDWAIMKEIFSYSLYIFGFSLFDQLNNSVDNLVLGWTVGTEVISVYAVGAMISGIILSFSSAILNVSIPEINKISSENKPDKLNKISELQSRYGRMIFLITSFILSGFVILGLPFIKLWIGNGYIEVYILALLLTFPKLFSNSMAISSEFIKAENRHTTRLIAYAVSILINIAISIPLAIEFGAFGAALGTFISFSMYTIFMHFYYSHKIRVNLYSFWKQVLYIVLILTLYMALSYWLSNFINLLKLWNFLVFGLCYSLGLFIIIFAFVLTRDEKRTILSFVPFIKK